ncbi:tripartite tricarboxylate transporter substrate binding protein [uncultured Desulfuromusa sp.]|uniref:tripartite tricarboxylate transporter substrate binding protein n=1 Tax=uncultured Desulfuromusa sp. TaxID=219183 RepID=UPI002AA7D2D3|nr:tripartite tricarboxylate transporter substrate binding protein [uncultured Desulfuromusa sp.]
MKKMFMLFVLSLSLILTSVSFADEWPNKNINLYIGFGAGGTTDMSARLLAQLLEEDLGVKVVTENKPGGGGVVLASLMSAMKPDGYSLMTLSASPVSITPNRQKLTYDPFADITLIAQYGIWNFAVAVPANSPFNTLKEMIEFARANPGKVTFSTSGTGNTQHLVMEQINTFEKIKMIAVPFKSGAEAAAAAMGGHVTCMVGVSEWIGPVKSGDMKLLASMDEERMHDFPDVPTLLELGYDFYADTNFLGIAGPGGMPEDIVKKIEASIQKATKDQRFIDLMSKLHFPIQFKGHKDWTNVAHSANRRIKIVLEGLGLGIKD